MNASHLIGQGVRSNWGFLSKSSMVSQIDLRMVSALSKDSIKPHNEIGFVALRICKVKKKKEDGDPI